MMTPTPEAILSEDPQLAPLVDRYGPIELDPATDPFARFVRSIARQQVSMAAGDAIADRLQRRHTLTPESMVDTDLEHLTDAGLSTQKAETVLAVAAAFRAQRITPDALGDMSNETIVSELTEIRGIGPWTAKMYLVFCLARPDVFPVEDLGVRRAMRTIVGVDDSRAAMVDRAERWRPVRSYAAMYLWAAED